MIKFDWRQFEPEDRRENNWPAFLSDSILHRFRDIPSGAALWSLLVEQIQGIGQDGGKAVLETRCLEVLDGFLDRVDQASAKIGSPLKPCIFISHQRNDTARAERVACIIDHHGLDCWLDVFDPTLALANRLPTGDPRKSVLIAAIIEIALLNSTHVIALHTANSAASRWVPYELGRAKARRIASPQAAGWFEKGRTPGNCGDYVQLAVCTDSESQVEGWLQSSAHGTHPSPPLSKFCTTHRTNELC